jgi:hypothetical protein
MKERHEQMKRRVRMGRGRMREVLVGGRECLSGGAHN